MDEAALAEELKRRVHESGVTTDAFAQLAP